MAKSMGERPGWARSTAAASSLALASVIGMPASADASPLVLRYEAYAAGFPVATFDFRLDESGKTYAVDGQIRTVGLLRLFYNVAMHAESQGTIAGAELRPRFHEHRLRSGGKDRQARLEFAGDGTVAAALVPPEESGRPKPTAQQILHTMDPLSAILAIGAQAAHDGKCAGRFAVFDGRRRYDLVLTDEGGERLEASSAYGYAGEVRRCGVAAVKIAGFSHDQDYQPHTTNGRVWLAPPKPGAPALPVRVDFDSSWGFVEIRMTEVETAR